MWKLVVREIHDDAELDGFLKDRYGSGCSLGEKEPTVQDGVYRARIQGDGKAMEETQCLLNYGTVVMYYPEGNKVISWHTGQAATFPADANYSVIHEMEMVESFNFIGAAASTAQDEEIIWDSEITSLDETWNLYTSNGQGFSIKFPKTMASYGGSCTWNEEQGSYRPQNAIVPVKIFEDSDAVYIAPEYYYELAGERIEDHKSYYDECNQVANSLELLRDPENLYASIQMWKLVAKEIHDDAELEGFLKDRYGSGCSLGEKEPTGQDGVYRVRILGDGKDLGKTQCPLNYGTVVKYYPAGNKVVVWDTGQAATFLADVNHGGSHDGEMVDSFSFIADAAAVPPVAPGGPLTSYTNDDYGFSFQYPADWALEVIPRRAPDAGPGSPQSLADAIVLTKGDLVISIQHLRMSEPAGWDGRFSGGGPYQEASQEWVTLIGQESRKWVWSDKDGIKAIEVHAVSEAADLVLQIALYDSSVEWIGDPEAESLPETALNVLYGILSSFKLTQ
jgi:hypothetical protein